jgi:hypothetical protein
MSTPRDATVGNSNDARDQHTPPHAPAGWQQTGERERERGERKRRKRERRKRAATRGMAQNHVRG